MKVHEHLSPSQQTSFDVPFDVTRTLIFNYKGKADGVCYISSCIFYSYRKQLTLQKCSKRLLSWIKDDSSVL